MVTRSIEDQARNYELEYTKSWTYIFPLGVFFFFFALNKVPRRPSSLKLSDAKDSTSLKYESVWEALHSSVKELCVDLTTRSQPLTRLRS